MFRVARLLTALLAFTLLAANSASAIMAVSAEKPASGLFGALEKRVRVDALAGSGRIDEKLSLLYDFASDFSVAARGGAGLIDDAARAVPTGSLRSPMKVPGPQNVPTTIGGRQYTGHALDQMQGRGLTPSVVEDTLARGVRTQGRDGASIFTTDQARVIVNPNGSIKTVYGQ